MPSVKAPNSPKVSDNNNDFATVDILLRGRNYHFVELSVDKYDDLVKMATIKSKTAEGEDQELIDNSVLRKLMTLASLQDPKLTTLQGLGMRLQQKLVNVAAELNYGDEPEEKPEKEKPFEVGEPEEETGEG